MPTVGRTLASERLRQDLDLDQIAAVTKIGSRSLKSIESDDFEQLPGRVFARNFVRQYAQVLKLDAAAIVAQFDREQSPPEPPFVSPKQKAEFRLNLPAAADLLGNTTLASFLSFAATIALCAGGVWIF
jgi:cytoskeletal protein RodZ